MAYKVGFGDVRRGVHDRRARPALPRGGQRVDFGTAQHCAFNALAALMFSNAMPIEQAVIGADRMPSSNRGQTAALVDIFRTTDARRHLPDRLSSDPRSPHHVAAVFEHDVGIRFNGKQRKDVEECGVSEGWIKVPAGKTVDRKGRPKLITMKGAVEAPCLKA